MEVKQLELSDQLVKYGILEVYYDNYKIEINFRRIDGDTDVIKVPVMQYAHDTIQQLDSLVNGSMIDITSIDFVKDMNYLFASFIVNSSRFFFG